MKIAKMIDMLRQRHISAWLPIILMMTAIFILSAQPKYGPSSPTSGVYFSGFIPVFPGIWETLIKKGMHVVMYAVLSALCMRGLLHEGATLEQAAYGAIVIAVLFACSDEWHQMSTFGRSASGIDIGIDFVGATLAALFMRRLPLGLIDNSNKKEDANCQ